MENQNINQIFSNSLIRVRKKSIKLLLKDSDQISIYFGAKLNLLANTVHATRENDDSQFAIFQVVCESMNPDVDLADLTKRIQVSFIIFFCCLFVQAV
jgi:hypothetical protein